MEGRGVCNRVRRGREGGPHSQAIFPHGLRMRSQEDIKNTSYIVVTYNSDDMECPSIHSTDTYNVQVIGIAGSWPV